MGDVSEKWKDLGVICDSNHVSFEMQNYLQRIIHDMIYEAQSVKIGPVEIVLANDLLKNPTHLGRIMKGQYQNPAEDESLFLMTDINDLRVFSPHMMPSMGVLEDIDGLALYGAKKKGNQLLLTIQYLTREDEKSSMRREWILQKSDKKFRKEDPSTSRYIGYYEDGMTHLVMLDEYPENATLDHVVRRYMKGQKSVKRLRDAV
jgi:hypothetical protein